MFPINLSPKQPPFKWLPNWKKTRYNTLNILNTCGIWLTVTQIYFRLFQRCQNNLEMWYYRYLLFMLQPHVLVSITVLVYLSWFGLSIVCFDFGKASCDKMQIPIRFSKLSMLLGRDMSHKHIHRKQLWVQRLQRENLEYPHHNQHTIPEYSRKSESLSTQPNLSTYNRLWNTCR